MLKKQISVIVTTFNGKELLAKYLPYLITACEYYSKGEIELIVVDDHSVDGTADYLKHNFTAIRVIEQTTNKGFASTANLGISSAKNRIVVLLNNDVQVTEGFFEFIPQHFNDPNVFALRPALKTNALDKDVNYSKERIGGAFRHGIIEVPRLGKVENGLAFFAGGGAAAFDREKFLALGGFDLLFAPFYFEDVDLSYRAWKRGWKVVYEPKAIVYHLIGGTIPRLYRKGYIERIVERNKYFLVWKNLSSGRLLLMHFIFIPVRIISFLLKLEFNRFVGFFFALKKISEVIKKRKAERIFWKVQDSQIFNFFKE